jgi:hypothetical protein
LLLIVLVLGSTIAAVLFRGERDWAVDAEGRAKIARREAQDLLANCCNQLRSTVLSPPKSLVEGLAAHLHDNSPL